MHARWLAWGALNLTSDVIYDASLKPWGTATPVHYYNWLMYRQTHADPAFTQSFAAIHELTPKQQRAAAGPYWPTTGYCTRANFESYGIRCLQH